MLKYLSLFFTISTVTFSNGAKWNDFRGGEVSLPIKLEMAESSGWVVNEVDENLKITWYSKDKNDILSVAYDKLGNCAGVRVIIYENNIDPDYLSLYKDPTGIFEAVEYNGQTAYKSVILFTPEGFLQKGGRKLKWMEEDEVAYYAYLKEAGKYKMLARETCNQYYGGYVEQGCHSNYGHVLSHFQTKSECNQLKPFYTVFNQEDGGDLVGFGWLFFNKVSTKDTFLKHITKDRAKELFPHSPSCLKSFSNLAVGEVWLSYTESQDTSCTSSTWVDKNCKKERPAKKSSSSDESDDSGSKDEPFWSKWFG